MSNPSPRPPDQRQALRELFHNRSFKLLWIGQLLSQVGDQCLLIAAITLISSLSQSPWAMLIPVISVAIPQLIFGLVGGVVADRWNRKLTMVGSDLLRGAILLCILLVDNVQHLWILYLASAGLAFMGVFFYPARNAVKQAVLVCKTGTAGSRNNSAPALSGRCGLSLSSYVKLMKSPLDELGFDYGQRSNL